MNYKGIMKLAGFFVLGCTLVLFACENPFRAGLGPIVDLQNPTVNIVSPPPGSPIRGIQEFTGVAWDDMGVELVQIMINPGSVEEQLLDWQDVSLSSARKSDGNWEWRHEIDTRVFSDGPLNIRLRVRDTADNEVETMDDIVFFIRNNPPAISMDFPRLTHGDMPGQLGSDHLNFGFAENFSYLQHMVDPFVGVAGMITDENGLSMPVQFRVWELIEPGSTPQHAEIPGIPRFPANELPDDLDWLPIGGDPQNRSSYFLPNPAPNPTSLLFFYNFPAPDAYGRFFAIQIRAQSSAGEGPDQNYQTLFPKDEWGYDRWDDLTPEQRIENSFVAFLVEAPQEPPILELLRFQDILRQGARDSETNEYKDKNIHPDEPHSFLAEVANIKKGPFTLRVRTSSSEGVSEAVAFWESDGERGLLIWDTATKHWNTASNVRADINHFTMWGYVDPYRQFPPTRNFIFTYMNNVDHDFHESGVHESARGRYRIQRFIGTDWDRLYNNINEAGGWDALLYSGNWADADEFWTDREEITIRVYARTSLGRVGTIPLITTVSVDRQAPSIALSEVEGSAGEGIDETTNETVHIVNDVIRMRFSVDDNISGIRFFEKPNGSQAEEVMFVLVRDSESVRLAMDGLDDNFWPLAPGGDPNEVPELPLGVSVYRHGLVADRNLLMQTRSIYGESDTELPEDGRYRLYLFARDRAFNVGRASFLLEVDAESDRPRFHFDMGINPGVTDPNVWPNNPSYGFVYSGMVRNRLRTADNIRFTIRDDDSLDLGTSVEPSTLRISIVGSRIGNDGEIIPLDSDDPDNANGYRLYLSDAQIKSIFPPQVVVAGRRVAVREWTGTVTQAMLLERLSLSNLYDELLSGHPPNAISLPDGIYRIRMEIWDDPSNKLSWPEGGDETAKAIRSQQVEFWIVVDERRPEIVRENVLPPEGGFISARNDVYIKGIVSDENGPINVVSFEARNNAPGGVTVNAGTQLVSLTRIDNDRVWEYEFAARIRMSELFPDLSSGEFVFYITMEDRFGNRETLRRMHLMDNTPPTVALRPGMGIRTFARPSAADRILVGNDNSLNATRLANKVLGFAVDATDDFAVGGIHWWLLPSNYGATENGLVPGGTITSFRSFPAMEADPQAALSTRGAFGRIPAPGGEAFIDTLGLNLPDGEYILHLIAADEAGNESVDLASSVVQTIFLFQDEDKPYFTPGIRPNMGELRGNDLVVTGVISDDDGFGSGMFPDPGSIEIWISTNDLAGVPSTETLTAAGWHRAVVMTNGRLIDDRHLFLEIDLQELTWTPPFVLGEGMKYYVIRAQDSHVNKLAPAGGPAGPEDRVANYSQVFSFMRDAMPPELELVDPLPGQNVGEHTFFLTGAIADANLRRTNAGNPYLLWRLNGQGSLVMFELDLTGDYVFEPSPEQQIIEAVGGMEVLHFRIPPARIMELFGDSLNDGSNTLELRVEDLTGAFQEISRSFVIDTMPPTVELRTGIETFSRPSVAGTYVCERNPYGIEVTGENAERLANKILRFNVFATDNIGVDAIHWWLLPASQPALSSFWSFPAREENPQAALGTDGAFGRIDTTNIMDGWVTIDTETLKLPDGEYRLHIIAIDTSGNESIGRNAEITSYMQTIFLLQEEDKPYFSWITPDNRDVVGEHNLLISGFIMDDDGFGTGMPAPDSVMVWLTRNAEVAGAENINRYLLDASPDWVQAVNLAQWLTLSGRNISLNLNLRNIFPNIFADPDDGIVYYVVRAADNETGVARYRLISFMLDTRPPEMEIMSPAPNLSFSVNPFYLYGTMSDAAFAKEDGYYFLEWNLDDRNGIFKLIPDYIVEETESAGGITTVRFHVPADTIGEAIDFDNISEGTHVLELTARDRAGLFKTVVVSFVIDRNPPDAIVNFPSAPVVLGTGDFADIDDILDWWWREPTGGAERLEWNKRRHEWALTAELPIVVRGELSTSLRGSLRDTVSDINTSATVFEIRWGTEPTESLRIFGSSASVNWEGEGRVVNWEIPLAHTMPDGIHTIRIFAQDNVGNYNWSDTFAFRLDSVAPEISADLDQLDRNVFGAPDRFPIDEPIFTLKGRASGANLSGIVFDFVHADGSPIPIPPDNRFIFDSAWDFEESPPVLDWSLSLTHDAFVLLSQGVDYEIRVSAENLRGVLSQPIVWNFKRDNTSPAIGFTLADGFTGYGDITPGTDNIGGFLRLFGTGPSRMIQGTVDDEHSEVYRVEHRIDRWEWDHGHVNNGEWKEGQWTQITDLSSRISSAMVDWRVILPDNFEAGLYRIRIRAMDISWFEHDPDNDDPWLIGLGNPAAPESWVYFFYDSGHPALDFKELSSISSNLPITVSSRLGRYQNANGVYQFKPGYLSFLVSAADANIINTISVQFGNLDAVVLNVFDMEIWNQDNFIVHVPIPFEGSNRVPDGNYTVTVIATNLSGRSANQTMTLGLDNTPPVGRFARPELVAGANDNLQISEHLLAGNNVVIEGDTFDQRVGAVESSVEFARGGMVHFRIGTFNGDWNFNADDLVAHYTGGQIDNASHDTAQFTHWFETAANNAATKWHQLIAGASDGIFHIPQGGDSVWNWRISMPLSHNGHANGRGIVEYIEKDVTHHAGGSIHWLPIWFRVVDSAGNASYFHRLIQIDTEGDRPIAGITNPTEMHTGLDKPRGGLINFDGAAEVQSEDAEVYSVLYRIWVGDEQRQGHRPGHLLTTLPANHEAVDDAEILNTLDALLPDTEPNRIGGWFNANINRDIVAPWGFTLNTYGELTDLIATHGFASADLLPRNTLRVWVEMVVLNGTGPGSKISLGDGDIDIPQTYSMSFFLTASAPEIRNVAVTMYDEYVDHRLLPLSGTFTITAELDPRAVQVSEIWIRLPHEIGTLVNSTLVWSDGNLRSTSLPGDIHVSTALGVRTLTYTIDSSVIQGSALATTGGVYHVEIRMVDSSDPPMEAVWLLPITIDNFAPVADPSLSANPMQAGTRGIFQGRVLDYGAPSPGTGFGGFVGPARVDRVYAWFTRERGSQTFFVQINDPTLPVEAVVDVPFLEEPVAGNSVQSRPVMRGRGASITNDTTVTISDAGTLVANGVPIPNDAINFPFGSATPDSHGGRFIREISQGRRAAETGRGLEWTEVAGGADVSWQFTVNTLRLPDGPLTLNYIVVDSAGNASFYQQHVVIMNRFPQIDRVILHTSNTDVAAVFPPRIGDVDVGTSMMLSSMQLGRTQHGFIDSGFIVRNHFVGFTVETILGNEPLYARLQHVTRTNVALNAETLNDRLNNDIRLFTIHDPGTIIDRDTWIALGVPVHAVPAGTLPVAGTHFVLRNPGPDIPLTGTAQVWQYTERNARDDVEVGADNEVLPNRPDIVNDYYSAIPGDNFNFAGKSNHFADTVVVDAGGYIIPEGNRIPQFLSTGSPLGTVDTWNRDDDPNRPFFLIRVWDSVTDGAEGTAGIRDPITDRLPEDDQLHTAVVIAMDVFLQDIDAPRAELYDLNPRFEEAINEAFVLYPPHILGVNRTRGGLFNVGTAIETRRSGHIEPRTTSSIRGHDPVNGNRFADGSVIPRDLVSGQVVLRGRATDNQRIRYVYLKLGDNEPTRILQWDDVENRIMVVQEGQTVGVDETLHWRYGHSVEWAFLWNTEELNGAAAPYENVRVSVLAIGYFDEKDSTNVPDGAGADAYNTIEVDVVPYIAGFERHNRYATIRSMQGWYSFYQGEEDITALGWNLGLGTRPSVNMPRGVGGTAIVTSEVERRVSDGMLSFVFNVPADAQSGRIDIGGADASWSIHNHNSDHRQFWNRENIFGISSSLWINRPYAHIWRSADTINGTTTMPRTYFGRLGGMALEYSGTTTNRGRLHGTWAVYGDSNVHSGRNDGTPTITSLTDRIQQEPWVMPDISILNGNANAGVNDPNIAFVHMRDGNATLRFTTRASITNVNVPATSTDSVDFRLLTALNPGGSTQRWENLRVSNAAPNALTPLDNPGRLYVTAFDGHVNRLVFITRDGTTNRQINIDGHDSTDGVINVGGISTSNNAGRYNAVGFDQFGPIVAYYDFANDTVRIAFASQRAPSAGNQWRRQEVLPSTAHADNRHRLHRGSGRHVSMTIDNSGNIHLAFFNSVHGALVYARANARTTANQASLTFTEVRVVDLMSGVGHWTDISVDHWGNPWIAYAYTGRRGQFDVVRMAFRTNGAGDANAPRIFFDRAVNCRVTGQSIQGWEAVQMAAPFMVYSDRINIEAWPPNNHFNNTRVQMNGPFREGASPTGREWHAAIGYRTTGGDNMFRIGYFFRPDMGRWPIN